MKVLPFTIPVPQGQTIIVQEDIQSHFYPHLHRHAEIQITLIKRGEGTLLAGNSMHYFEPGHIYIIGANMPHLFKSSPEYFKENSNLTIHELTVFFDPEGKLSALFGLPEMQQVLKFLEEWRAGFKIPDEHLAVFTGYINKIKQAQGALRLSLFIEMIEAITAIEGLEPLSPITQAPAMTDPEGMRIASVINYIMHNYNGSLPLADVARQAHLTPNAFCRYFKQHTRVTFVTFVNKVRVNEACKLLINKQLNNIADVAYSCGFRSVNNFNLVFKSVMGKSPREYVNDYSLKIK
jgi:AraC-like DNA-binding protein